MQMPDFRLERYFARWEFVASHLLCSSDMESYRLNDLLALADDEGRELWQICASAGWQRMTRNY